MERHSSAFAILSKKAVNEFRAFGEIRTDWTVWWPNRNDSEYNWIMIQVVRRSLAIVSGSGLFASIVIYIASYGGATMDAIFRWAIVLHIGIFVLLLPIYAVEYSTVRQRTFFSKGFARGMPRWVVPSTKLLALFFAVHFVLFLAQSHGSAPEIKNGEYVLNDHGKIVKTLTQSEFYKLKGAELRLFATEWMFFYLVPTVYCWFTRTEQETIGKL